MWMQKQGLEDKTPPNSSFPHSQHINIGMSALLEYGASGGNKKEVAIGPAVELWSHRYLTDQGKYLEKQALYRHISIIVSA